MTREAVLLCGGDESGNPRFYREMIAKAGNRAGYHSIGIRARKRQRPRSRAYGQFRPGIRRIRLVTSGHELESHPRRESSAAALYFSRRSDE